ncbi:hypothetical protein FANTH_12978 [Fusarium anthophilum]|uniref:Amine oxidase n=1 Tax=Fusarium anthophilum TaxID=48485 RepID=A0A8H4YQF6_9HYPO|nr:hypothetical protein FANTH_12978 [Fusarium anthophilum]
MPSIKAIDLANTSGGYYAPAVSAAPGSQIIHFSGQPGILRNGHLPSNYKSQIHLAILNLRKIIITSRASIQDIVKLTFDAATAQDATRIRDMVEADCQALDKACPQNSEFDAQTFEAYLRSRRASETAIATATVWTRAMLGQDPKDISALFPLSYCRSGGGLLQMRSDAKGGGQHLRVRQGMQIMANGLAGALNKDTVRLSSPVLSVEQHLVVDAIDVTTESEVIRASKVITTVPSPVLKTIDFTLKLPVSKVAWAESSTYGYYTKAMMVFRSPFWVKKGYCGLIRSFTGPAGVIRDSSSLPDKKYIMTCFMGSDPGREWSLLTTKDREQVLIKQIGKLFDSPKEAESEFMEMVTYEWTKDEFSGWGCPCPALTPGVLDTIGDDSLRKPCGGLHFAGKETEVEWKGYMEGTVESGERAADEVIQALKSGINSRL